MNFKNKHTKIFFLSVILFGISCKKAFLDVVPDNVATLSNAFTSANEAEKYLFTCYDYMPNDADAQVNPGMTAGDEIWCEYPDIRISNRAWRIARGLQNVTSPYINYMEGENGAPSMYKAIRDCNIFLENVTDKSKILDLAPDTRDRWIGEATFLKAYYHFVLLRAYGPIPIIDKNLPINAPIEDTRIKRQPVDTVVNYIANLLDKAATTLPPTIRNKATELGRVTKAIALSVKARLLVTAASPLFNGNPDYASFKDKNGVQLFNPAFSPQKWQRAAAACKAAIDLCDSTGIRLYTFTSTSVTVSPTTAVQMNIRNATSEKWNSELIWGLARNDNSIQYYTAPHFDPANATNTGGFPTLGPTLKMAQLFYSKNGVPINEDKTLDFSSITSLRVATHEERFNLIENYTTARLNFDREPRFYGALGFDGCTWFMASSSSDENTWNMQCRVGQFGSAISTPVTGYFIKKAVNWHDEWVSGGGFNMTNYAWPEMRLADLYLLYAEALNEASGPSADVYSYVNKVRARAGLETVESSWANYSNNPSKYTSKEGMRSIIQQERGIELSFEGQRYWDMLRWKTAAQEINGNVKGWDRTQTDPALYYRPITFFSQKFQAPRDYLWPIKEDDLLNNQNLVQNPGW